jgi:hypothetical protein
MQKVLYTESGLSINEANIPLVVDLLSADSPPF